MQTLTAMNNNCTLPLFSQETKNSLNVTIPRYSLKLVRESSVSYNQKAIKSASIAYDFLCGIGLQDRASEEFYSLYLNTKNRIIGIEMISRGTLNASLIHPREVFKGALLANANCIMLAHNHPSGNPEPSNADKQVTSILVKAGKLLDVQVLDHIIVGDESYFSFRESGLL